MNKEAANAIAVWLNGHKKDFSDYDKGLMLLDAYSNDHSKHKRLSSFKQPSALFDALRELWQDLSFAAEEDKKNEVKIEIINTAAIEYIEQVGVAAKPKSGTPKHVLLDKLQSEWRALRKKSGAWQVKLYWVGRNIENGAALPLTAKDKEERELLAKQIMAYERKITEIQADINFVSIHGHLPHKEKTKKAKSKVVFDYKTYENTRKKIYTAEKTVIPELKALLKITPADKLPKLNERLDKWEKKLSELRVLFDQLQNAKDGL